MSFKVIIPHLQIGEFRVDTPIGLSELLQDTWTNKPINDDVEEFVSNYDRTVFKNEKGQIVTRYSLKVVS